MSELPLFSRARTHGDRVAFRTSTGFHTYRQLLEQSARLARNILGDSNDLDGARVALLVTPGFDYVAAQWAIWRAGGVYVPLCLSATDREWEYTLTDSDARIAATDSAMADKFAPVSKQLGIRVIHVDTVPGPSADGAERDSLRLPAITPDRPAMILYTSGTTNKPKGVVTTHANIQAQIESLCTAWEWTADDRIPLFLPLHHIHGIINIVGCALWSGATIEPFSKFDVPTILERVQSDAYTVFMAVPTIYVKLIQSLESAAPVDRATIVEGFARLRLMVSGSAALPVSVHEKWFALTGQTLLERYGMTEIGMGLSNPYRDERRPGAVGVPLPGVEVRLKAESGEIVTGEDDPGEIQVRGPGVFGGYWRRPEVNADAFDEGWFRTGDIAIVEGGYYRILGRLSVDIIKSGGYKLSALEIEAVLLEHPDIRECAVIGMADDTWGEVVTAAVVLRPSATLDLCALREWCRDRLSAYKIPQRLLVINELPRNAMGKVTKPALRALF